MRKLKFPSYEYIKSLPKNEEYDWLLFETPTSVYGRISYNEDSSGYIYFDVVEGGYVEKNSLGLALKFNKKNYKDICNRAQEVFEEFYRRLDQDCSNIWEREARESVQE